MSTLKTLAMGVSYLGAHYHGWQTQPDGSAVQDYVEQALARFACQPISVICSGRTDSGVHALGQVIHFQTTIDRPMHAWLRGVNTFLPKDIRIRWVKDMPMDFHARFSALSRSYVYILHNHPTESAIWHQRAGWYYRPLDEVKMQKALDYLVGTHDFSAFRASQCQAHSPIRTLEYAKIVRHGDLLLIVLRANAFLYHMVRNIVGALIYVGDGRQSPEWIHYLLEQKDRKQSAPTFMSDGLYFAQAHYPKQYNLDCLAEFDPLRPLDSLNCAL